MKKILLILALTSVINCSYASYALEHKKDVFVVVTGLSTGELIAPMLKGYGYDVVHVSSKIQQKLGCEANKYDYIASYYESDDINFLINQLKKHGNIKAIIPGTDSGVALAEKINYLLGLPYSNDYKLSDIRQNKFDQQEALKNANVSSINQYLAKELSEVKEWREKNDVKFPIVLKPVDSSSTDNVFICKDEEEVKIAFSKIISSVDKFKNKNQVVLCQEYIGGQEYMINTVSWNKNHRIIELLKSNKKIINGRPLYDTSEVIEPNSSDFKLIDSYLRDVYKALEINYGAAHAEVKVWKRNGKKVVTLIELGARLGGIASTSALQDSQGDSQVSVLVKSYVNPGSLNELPKLHLKKKVAAVYLINNSYTGNVIKDLDTTRLSELKTYHSLHFQYIKGSFLPKTTDLTSAPGYIYLVSDSEQEIQKDIKTIRQLENKIYADLLGSNLK